MKFRRRRSLESLASILFLLAMQSQAQDINDGTLHVVRPVIHAAQQDAEFCLEFDHDLDSGLKTRIPSMIKLEQNGKTVPVRLQNISLAADLLCLSSLDHRREYRISVAGLRGSKGEKLEGSYGLGFTIPDRQPSLAFIGSSVGMLRWGENDPVLRSVNVSRVTLELIRITDPASMTEAWRERRQTTLAPSESVTFGHDKGQSIWTSSLELGDTPNKNRENTVPLSDKIKNLSPGLYLLLAKTPIANDKTPLSEKNEKEPLAPAAATWLLRSDMRLRALQDSQGIYALTSKADAPETLSGVHLIVEDGNGQKLAEADAGADGMAFLGLKDDPLKKAATLLGMTSSGDVDFVDLKTLGAMGHFISPGNDVAIALDHPFYAPGDPVLARLSIRDAAHNPLAATDATLQLLRPTGSFYAQTQAPTDATGTGKATFNAPAMGGVWQLVWQRANGERLAKSTLRVTSDNAAPRIEISTPRQLLPANGEVNLTLKSLTAAEKPAPNTMGRVMGAWTVPDHAFQGADGYVFGDGERPAGPPSPLTSFMTDANGVAEIHIVPPPPSDHEPLHALQLSLKEDPASGVAVPPPLTLPVRPTENIVGIRPLAADGRFPENGLARFSIIELDPEGRRRAADDLSWQVYEEGRSFDWYQSDGRWKYKPTQEKRRMGGGALTVGDSGETYIEWPVTAGSYRLEITDAEGHLRSALDFSAGWETPHVSALSEELKLDAPEKLMPGQEAHIHFKLEKPSVISAVIGDDRVRRILHERRPQGDNVIAFVPGVDWSDQIQIRVIDEAHGHAGDVTVPLLKEDAGASKPQETPIIDDMLSLDEEYPTIMREGDAVRLSFNLKNTGKTATIDHYALTVRPGLKLTEAPSGAVNLAALQSRKIFFTLTAQQASSSGLKLEVTSFPKLHADREWNVAVTSPELKLVHQGGGTLDPGQSWSDGNRSTSGERPTATTDDDVLMIAPSPLYQSPAHLSDLLAAHPVTSAEMAAVLDALRLWRDPILAAGLVPATAFDATQKDLLLRLLERQKPDGGFSERSDGEADIGSTARTLGALSRSSPDIAKAGADLAASWLRGRLDNTWFDEKERPVRAAAYAALAGSDRLDASSLYYFSDTSLDKSLPPLAAAQLALAFSKLGDQAKTSFWLDVAGVKKKDAAIGTELLLPLAGNTFFDVDLLLPSLERLGLDVDKTNLGNLESLTAFMRTVAIVSHRKGAWRVTLGTDKRNPKDILTLPVTSKTGFPDIHAGDHPLYFVGSRKTRVPDTKEASLQRRIYELNGQEVQSQASLKIDTAYLVIVSGNWLPDAGTTLRLHDNAGPIWRIEGCLPPPPLEAGQELSWLKSQPLSEPLSCEAGSGGIDMMIERAGNASQWKVAYLARGQWAGTVTLPPASAQPMDGKDGAQKSAANLLKIR